jgi:hypothetical protein
MHNQSKTVVAIEWIATSLLILSTALTSWNIYPLNVITSIIGGTMWTWISWKWRKSSLVVLNLVLLTILVSGLIFK